MVVVVFFVFVIFVTFVVADIAVDAVIAVPPVLRGGPLVRISGGVVVGTGGTCVKMWDVVVARCAVVEVFVVTTRVGTVVTGTAAAVVVRGGGRVSVVINVVGTVCCEGVVVLEFGKGSVVLEVGLNAVVREKDGVVVPGNAVDVFVGGPATQTHIGQPRTSVPTEGIFPRAAQEAVKGTLAVQNGSVGCVWL